MISIIVTTHNCEEYLRDTLASVAAQTVARDALDIVVVDSESTDGTRAVAERAASDLGMDVRFIQTVNLGPSHARNVGARETRAEWVQFIDGDDVMHPMKLALQVAAVERARNSDASLYSNWVRMHLRNGHWSNLDRSEMPDISDHDAVQALLHGENFVQVGAQLFRKRWLDKVGGFDERLWLIEDVDLMLRLAMAGATFHRVDSDEPLLFYRQRPESLSRRDQSAFVDACMRNAEMVEVYWRRVDELTPTRRHLLAEVHRNGCQYYAMRDRRRFNRIAAHIETLVPGFLPSSPPRVRQASRLLGYRRAETLAVAWRRLIGA